MNNPLVKTEQDNEQIKQLATEIRYMMQGTSNLNDREALALAQVARMNSLNPFLGECWYIPKSGVMVGIKGARRKAKEQIVEEGGKSAYYFVDIFPCDPEEAGALEPDVIHAYRAELHDSVTTGMYMAQLKDAIDMYRDMGLDDPVMEARKTVGPKPMWVGYGYSTRSEKTRMNKKRVARKRAESEALSQRFHFGFTVSYAESATEEEVDGEVVAAPEWINDSEEEQVAALTGEPTPSSGSREAAFPFDKKRPWDAEDLQERMYWLANNEAKNSKVTASHAQRGLAKSMFTELFPDEAIRKEALKYLTGYSYWEQASDEGISSHVIGSFIHALLWWIAPEKNTEGAYVPNKVAIAEATRVSERIKEGSL